MKICFRTYGCTLNFADSEMMQGLLQEAGHETVRGMADADLIVINGCTVKHLAEKKFFRTLQDAEHAGNKVVLAGCVVQAEPGYLDDELKGYSVIGTKQLNHIVHVVEQTLAGKAVQMLAWDRNEHLNVPVARRNPSVGIVPIAEGCLGECTYCKSRLARGKLTSYDPDAIAAQVRSHVKDGCREVWLTSQDCGAYGKDIGTDIVTLLRAVCSVEGDFFVRLGMMNPNFALEYLEGLVSVFKENKGKLFRFIHLPVQAGSDRVLGRMKRKYSSEDFISVCERLRSEMPDITIATDVICGFPTETEKEFQDTVRLIRKVQPDVINVSRFWPRPGTPAAAMEGQLHGRDTNSRSRKMQKVKQEISLLRNRTWEGWSGSVIVDEKGSVGASESWIGRNYAYKPVALKGSFSSGSVIDTKPVKARRYYLEGSL